MCSLFGDSLESAHLGSLVMHISKQTWLRDSLLSLARFDILCKSRLRICLPPATRQKPRLSDHPLKLAGSSEHPGVTSWPVRITVTIYVTGLWVTGILNYTPGHSSRLRIGVRRTGIARDTYQGSHEYTKDRIKGSFVLSILILPQSPTYGYLNTFLCFLFWALKCLYKSTIFYLDYMALEFIRQQNMCKVMISLSTCFFTSPPSFTNLQIEYSTPLEFLLCLLLH